MRKYSYEVWLDGSALRNSESGDNFYDTEVEAMEEAEDTIYDLLFEEGYESDGYEFDDFEIVIREFY